MNGTGSVGLPWVVILGFIRIAALDYTPRVRQSSSTTPQRMTTMHQTPFPFRCDAPCGGWPADLPAIAPVPPSPPPFGGATRHFLFHRLDAGRRLLRTPPAGLPTFESPSPKHSSNQALATTRTGPTRSGRRTPVPFESVAVRRLARSALHGFHALPAPLSRVGRPSGSLP